MYDRMYRTDRWEYEGEVRNGGFDECEGTVVPVLISVYLVGLIVLGEGCRGQVVFGADGCGGDVVSVVVFFVARPVRGGGLPAAVMGGADLLHLREIYEGRDVVDRGTRTLDEIFF